jgi:hypothetical protein
VPQRYADIATTVALLLIPLVGDDSAGIATPDDLTGRMPFARATRIGGPRDGLNDLARIAVDVFDDDYARGSTLAEDIAGYLEPGRLRLGPVLLDRVAVDQAPQEVVPWAPGIFRWEARYMIVSRRYETA